MPYKRINYVKVIFILKTFKFVLWRGVRSNMDGIMIKEAAAMLGVETHVLRYWEEELGLEIKRNSMGHRYYDERDIKLFKDVKELKKRGLSLKDIRCGIENKRRLNEANKPNDNSSERINTSKNTSGAEIDNSFEINNEIKETTNNIHNNMESDNKLNSILEPDSDAGKIVDFKMAQLQTAMNRIVANALRENKDIITTSIKAEITADVMRQFDTVMREKEEREEARFKKLDECLRQIQLANAEVAATKAKGLFRKRKK